MNGDMLVNKMRMEDEEKTEIMIQRLIMKGMDPIVIEILCKDFLVDLQEYHGEVLLGALPEAGSDYTEFKKLGVLMMDEEIGFSHSGQEFVLEDKDFLELAEKLMEL